ncbi:MAG TPA: glycoside hydrolase family 15 protein [Pseudolabrys sp.]|nr:glycoside hydrolase family 15 protein [Pseudolabrys sp.]
MGLRIEDYALIGDCQSAALVGRNGSIDWLCWPRFDSDACFAALLGDASHGRWLITPQDPHARITRRYRPNTLILETRFETAEGAATVIDFMPGRPNGSSLVRIVVGERGQVAMRTELVIRFGYGAAVPWVMRLPDGALRAIAGPDMLFLRTPVELRGENMKTVGEFSVSDGDAIPFSLTYSPSHWPPPEPDDPFEQIYATESFWTKWIAQAHPKGPWADQLTRSLITLKALTFARTGGIVAAPTTSLPEAIGGPRNWDYRFCWLRDATFTLLALRNAGYHEEAQAWRDWLLRAAAGSPDQLQIMYGIGGERRLTEWEVPWLPGYENSMPVRIGNAAHNQLQLDVYGEVVDALYQGRQAGLGPSEYGWELQTALLAHLETIWQEPDEGIWEVRSGREHFTHSKVMAWVAFDRAIKGAEAFLLPGPLDRWRAACKAIKDEVCAKGFDAELGSFVRSYGSKELDASLLMLPGVGFLPANDPRIRGTVEAIERRLLVDGFVQRYDSGTATDGLPAGEGVFLACSFWLVDAYVLLGRTKDARKLFEKLIGLTNDVGLLSEEYDPAGRRQLGNFPQALSHIALVNSAFNLGHAAKPVHQRAEPETTPAE